MNFIKHSITFKIVIIATVLVSVYELGLISEGRAKGYIVFPWMWFIHIVSTFPRLSNGSLSDVLTYAFTNGFHFYGAIVCLFIIRRYVRNGEFQRQGRKAFWVLVLVSVFCISTVWHYLAMFVGQEDYFSDMGYFFATEVGEFAFNAYDNIISIAILIQIAQATILTALKGGFKRQVSA